MSIHNPIVDPDNASPLDAALSQRDRGTLEMVQIALRANNCMLAFQPIVQAQNGGAIAFYEGLFRVLDVTGRVIPAKEFMPVVESRELGREIDCTALRLGLEALVSKPELRLSINMSARSIGYPKWLNTLRHGLQGNPTVAERLILEITETSAMVMPELVVTFMRDLQGRGICFALDDFGAGYTAFRYLRDFFFDIVKIDGSFIRNVDKDPDNQVLIQALITISKQFDMFTVAEAVETRAEAEFLVRNGIDCMQGYYYGVPEVNPEWLTDAKHPGAGSQAT